MGTADNIIVGAASIYLDGVDIGFTKGGATVRYEQEQFEVAADQVVGIVRKARSLERMFVSTTMLEPTLERLRQAFMLPETSLRPELVTNGDFATGDLTGWTDVSNGGAVSVVAQVCILDGSGVGKWAKINNNVEIPVVVGETYVLTFITTGDDVTLMGVFGTDTVSAGSHSYEWTANASSIAVGGFDFESQQNSSSAIDDISIKLKTPGGDTLVLGYNDSCWVDEIVIVLVGKGLGCGTRTFTFAKCVTFGEREYTMQREEEVAFEVEFECLKDATGNFGSIIDS